MQKINLSDRPNHIRPYAALELKARAALPENDGSYEQALLLLETEYKRWKQTGEYNPSWLTQKVITALDKQATQRFVAGLVGVAMFMLPYFGKRRSLENASSVVSEYANAVGKSAFAFWNGAGWTEDNKRIVGDLSTIKQHFRRYRSVAHICAAEVTCSGYLTPRQPFEQAPEADACFIHTCLMFQSDFRKVANFSDWNLFEIQLSPTPEFSKAVSLVPDRDTVVNLFGPWLDTQEA